VATASSIASGRRREGRPERSGAGDGERRGKHAGIALLRDKTKEKVSRSAVMGKEGYGQREGRCTSVALESNEIDGGDLQVFDEKFIGLERPFVKEKKGEKRGDPGPFIGIAALRRGLGLARGEAMDDQEGVGRG
jgi:hypothetical protein